MKILSSPYPPATDSNLFWKIASLLFLVVVFVLHCRIFDVAAHGFRIPLVLFALLSIAFLGSGRVLMFWGTTAGKILPGLIAWAALAFFLNPHNYDGFVTMKSMLMGAALFTMAAGLMATVVEFNKLFNVLGASSIVLALMGVIWGTTSSGRFALSTGIYMDANYYAMWLLAAMPLLWTIALQQGRGLRIALFAASLLPLLMAARTASRGGLVAFAVMVAVLFFLSSNAIRIVIVTLGALALVALVSLAPDAIRARFLPSSVSGTERSEIDNASARARETLLVGSIGLTLDNPVLGVGPGNFPQALVDVGKAQGQNWLPLATHNAYTEISSEIGLPGFLLFAVVAVFSVSSVVSVLRQTRPRGATPNVLIYQQACGLLLALSALLTALFFLSEAYNLLVYLWLGMATGLRLLIPRPPREAPELED